MLNKTLKESAKKTKLAPRGVPLLVLAILTAPMWLTRPAENLTDYCKGVEVNNKCIALEYAETARSRAQGLSGREFLGSNSGMLFIFDKSKKECMWMKDMQFAIDIIWLDEEQRITKIMDKVQPSSYPESYCTDDTKYVLELNANEARNLDLYLGQQIDL